MHPPYTFQEKFNTLAERNPALLDLQPLLRSDMEYFLSYGTYYRAYVNENDQLVYEVVGEQ
jgi:hypothetical protein